MEFHKSYAEWRATLPWTDEEFAAACEAEAACAPSKFVGDRYRRLAAAARRGSITRWTLRVALPRLITRCNICGKKALYQQGVEGRCREHRLITTQAVREWAQRRDAIARDLEEDLDETDRLRRRGDQLRNAHRTVDGRVYR